MADDLSSTMRRVKKLLNIANDKRADPNEAAAAMSQAERIMRHYQISMAEIIQEELKVFTDQTFNFYDVDCTIRPAATRVTRPDPWAGFLAVGVAKLNSAQAKFIVDKVFGRMIRFEGYAPDVQICKFSWRYILNQMRKHKGSDDFNTGYAAAVLEQLQLAKELKDQENMGSPGSRSLVIVKDSAVEQHFGKVEYGRSSTRAYGEDYNRGHAEGSKLDALMRGIEHKPSSSPTMKRIK